MVEKETGTSGKGFFNPGGKGKNGLAESFAGISASNFSLFTEPSIFIDLEAGSFYTTA